MCSCMGPILHILYISRPYHVIANHLPSAHGYADDTQLYLSFEPNGRSSQDITLSYIGKICSKAFHGLYKIRQIKKFLSPESTKTLIHAFATSHLDYCNSLLFGVPKYPSVPSEHHVIIKIKAKFFVCLTMSRSINFTSFQSGLCPVLWACSETGTLITTSAGSKRQFT